MFTGLVEEIGEIISIESKNKIENQEKINYKKITIAAKKILKDIKLGDSIAVNGVCQTVVAYKRKFTLKPYFVVEALQVTLDKTNFSHLKTNDRVNLEPSLTLKRKLGGHMLHGVVECTAKVFDLKKEHNNVYLYIQLEKDKMKYIIKEGSISIDGISLTIADVDLQKNTIMLNIIPHTYEHTIIKYYEPQSIVNIEFDMIIKYVYHTVSSLNMKQ